MPPHLKVLCVDDNREAARSTAQLLAELAECEVQVCHDGPSALATAEWFHPDVCVLDLAMPGMDGDELAARLCERAGRQVRCIALTGLWDIQAQHRTHNVGFAEHLVKPVDPERLIEAITGGSAVGG